MVLCEEMAMRTLPLKLPEWKGKNLVKFLIPQTMNYFDTAAKVLNVEQQSKVYVNP